MYVPDRAPPRPDQPGRQLDPSTRITRHGCRGVKHLGPTEWPWRAQGGDVSRQAIAARYYLGHVGWFASSEQVLDTDTNFLFWFKHEAPSMYTRQPSGRRPPVESSGLLNSRPREKRQKEGRFVSCLATRFAPEHRGSCSSGRAREIRAIFMQMAPGAGSFQLVKDHDPAEGCGRGRHGDVVHICQSYMLPGNREQPGLSHNAQSPSGLGRRRIVYR